VCRSPAYLSHAGLAPLRTQDSAGNIYTPLGGMINLRQGRPIQLAVLSGTMLGSDSPLPGRDD